ncbi:MAG TPA: hypothetical protein PLC59_10905 [Bacteroidales bacterium]|mgnify:FL=1|nr:hypothetical protein [Bacteroidales bacterium]
MQQRIVVSNGKRFRVNCPTEDGVGAGFAAGQLVMKSFDDNKWYIVTASGSAGDVDIHVNQSPLPFTYGPVYSQQQLTASIVDNQSFFEQNFPYQIVASDDGNAYAVYLTGTPPTVTFTISQSIYGKAYITNSLNAHFDIAKPHLFLQNITDGNYYIANLSTSGGTTSISVSQTMISQSWVHPIY